MLPRLENGLTLHRRMFASTWLVSGARALHPDDERVEAAGSSQTISRCRLIALDSSWQTRCARS